MVCLSRASTLSTATCACHFLPVFTRIPAEATLTLESQYIISPLAQVMLNSSGRAADWWNAHTGWLGLAGLLLTHLSLTPNRSEPMPIMMVHVVWGYVSKGFFQKLAWVLPRRELQSGVLALAALVVVFLCCLLSFQRHHSIHRHHPVFPGGQWLSQM